MDFIKTLDLLKDWKQLPSYRAEPRVDFIVAGALPEIIKFHLNDEVDLIIPELPIRIGSIFPDKNINKSFKVDFYVLLKSGRNIFIEFKTDMSSRRTQQDDYLQASVNAGMNVVLDGIVKINDATSSAYKHKYDYLLNKLRANNLISINSEITCLNDNIELLYIQPVAHSNNEIGFDTVSDIMMSSEDIIYKYFGELLKSWSI